MYIYKNNLQNYSCKLKCTCAYLSVWQQVINIGIYYYLYFFFAKSNSATYAWEISFEAWWRKRGIKCKPTGNYHGSINRLTEMYLTSETKLERQEKNAVMHILPKNLKKKCMLIISSKYKYYLINIVFIVQNVYKCLKVNTLNYRIIRRFMFRCKDSKHYILQLNVHFITSKDLNLLVTYMNNKYRHFWNEKFRLQIARRVISSSKPQGSCKICLWMSIYWFVVIIFNCFCKPVSSSYFRIICPSIILLTKHNLFIYFTFSLHF